MARISKLTAVPGLCRFAALVGGLALLSSAATAQELRLSAPIDEASRQILVESRMLSGAVEASKIQFSKLQRLLVFRVTEASYCQQNACLVCIFDAPTRNKICLLGGDTLKYSNELVSLGDDSGPVFHLETPASGAETMVMSPRFVIGDKRIVVLPANK